jgi:hypothetical protein
MQLAQHGGMRFPTRWVVWIILVAALAFLAGGVSNVVHHSWAEAAAGLGVGGFLLAVFFNQRREQRGEAEFREWLRANATALSQGGACYRGRWVTSGTRTRQLTLCVSMLIVGFRLPSRPFIEGADRIGGRTFVYTGVTLLLGWWSIHGLFWTPGALLGNLRGGRESTVGAALAAMGPT